MEHNLTDLNTALMCLIIIGIMGILKVLYQWHLMNQENNKYIKEHRKIFPFNQDGNK